MDKIKNLENSINEKVISAKDELINLGVELESFYFEFEPRYKKLLEYLENSGKINLSFYLVGFALFIPSLLYKEDFVVYFAPPLDSPVVTKSSRNSDSQEKIPYLYISIPSFSSTSSEEINSYLLPGDSFSLTDGDITLRFTIHSVKYKELIL